jgi:hypothetical protein
MISSANCEREAEFLLASFRTTGAGIQNRILLSKK